MLSCACFDRHTFESPQSAEGSAWRFWEAKVNLHNFVAISCARILHVDVYSQWFASFQFVTRQLQICVLEPRVAQSETERVERLSLKVSVRAILHCIVFKRRQLIDALVESHRKAACRIVNPG